MALDATWRDEYDRLRAEGVSPEDAFKQVRGAKRKRLSTSGEPDDPYKGIDLGDLPEGLGTMIRGLFKMQEHQMREGAAQDRAKAGRIAADGWGPEWLDRARAWRINAHAAEKEAWADGMQALGNYSQDMGDANAMIARGEVEIGTAYENFADGAIAAADQMVTAIPRAIKGEGTYKTPEHRLPTIPAGTSEAGVRAYQEFYQLGQTATQGVPAAAGALATIAGTAIGSPVAGKIAGASIAVVPQGAVEWAETFSEGKEAGLSGAEAVGYATAQTSISQGLEFFDHIITSGAARGTLTSLQQKKVKAAMKDVFINAAKAGAAGAGSEGLTEVGQGAVRGGVIGEGVGAGLSEGIANFPQAAAHGGLLSGGIAGGLGAAAAGADLLSTKGVQGVALLRAAVKRLPAQTLEDLRLRGLHELQQIRNHESERARDLREQQRVIAEEQALRDKGEVPDEIKAAEEAIGADEKALAEESEKVEAELPEGTDEPEAAEEGAEAAPQPRFDAVAFADFLKIKGFADLGDYIAGAEVKLETEENPENIAQLNGIKAAAENEIARRKRKLEKDDSYNLEPTPEDQEAYDNKYGREDDGTEDDDPIRETDIGGEEPLTELEMRQLSGEAEVEAGDDPSVDKRQAIAPSAGVDALLKGVSKAVKAREGGAPPRAPSASRTGRRGPTADDTQHRRVTPPSGNYNPFARHSQSPDNEPTRSRDEEDVAAPYGARAQLEFEQAREKELPTRHEDDPAREFDRPKWLVDDYVHKARVTMRKLLSQVATKKGKVLWHGLLETPGLKQILSDLNKNTTDTADRYGPERVVQYRFAKRLAALEERQGGDYASFSQVVGVMVEEALLNQPETAGRRDPQVRGGKRRVTPTLVNRRVSPMKSVKEHTTKVGRAHRVTYRVVVNKLNRMFGYTAVQSGDAAKGNLNSIVHEPGETLAEALKRSVQALGLLRGSLAPGDPRVPQRKLAGDTPATQRIEENLIPLRVALTAALNRVRMFDRERFRLSPLRTTDPDWQSDVMGNFLAYLMTDRATLKAIAPKALQVFEEVMNAVPGSVGERARKNFHHAQVAMHKWHALPDDGRRDLNRTLSLDPTQRIKDAISGFFMNQFKWEDVGDLLDGPLSRSLVHSAHDVQQARVTANMVLKYGEFPFPDSFNDDGTQRWTPKPKTWEGAWTLKDLGDLAKELGMTADELFANLGRILENGSLTPEQVANRWDKPSQILYDELMHEWMNQPEWYFPGHEKTRQSDAKRYEDRGTTALEEQLIADRFEAEMRERISFDQLVKAVTKLGSNSRALAQAQALSADMAILFNYLQASKALKNYLVAMGVVSPSDPSPVDLLNPVMQMAMASYNDRPLRHHTNVMQEIIDEYAAWMEYAFLHRQRMNLLEAAFEAQGNTDVFASFMLLTDQNHPMRQQALTYIRGQAGRFVQDARASGFKFVRFVKDGRISLVPSSYKKGIVVEDPEDTILQSILNGQDDFGVLQAAQPEQLGGLTENSVMLPFKDKQGRWAVAELRSPELVRAALRVQTFQRDTWWKKAPANYRAWRQYWITVSPLFLGIAIQRDTTTTPLFGSSYGLGGQPIISTVRGWFFQLGQAMGFDVRSISKNMAREFEQQMQGSTLLTQDASLVLRDAVEPNIDVNLEQTPEDENWIGRTRRIAREMFRSGGKSLSWLGKGFNDFITAATEKPTRIGTGISEYYAIQKRLKRINAPTHERIPPLRVAIREATRQAAVHGVNFGDNPRWVAMQMAGAYSEFVRAGLIGTGTDGLISRRIYRDMKGQQGYTDRLRRPIGGMMLNFYTKAMMFQALYIIVRLWIFGDPEEEKKYMRKDPINRRRYIEGFGAAAMAFFLSKDKDESREDFYNSLSEGEKAVYDARFYTPFGIAKTAAGVPIVAFDLLASQGLLPFTGNEKLVEKDSAYASKNAARYEMTKTLLALGSEWSDDMLPMLRHNWVTSMYNFFVREEDTLDRPLVSKDEARLSPALQQIDAEPATKAMVNSWNRLMARLGVDFADLSPAKVDKFLEFQVPMIKPLFDQFAEAVGIVDDWDPAWGENPFNDPRVKSQGWRRFLENARIVGPRKDAYVGNLASRLYEGNTYINNYNLISGEGSSQGTTFYERLSVMSDEEFALTITWGLVGDRDVKGYRTEVNRLLDEITPYHKNFSPLMTLPDNPNFTLEDKINLIKTNTAEASRQAREGLKAIENGVPPYIESTKQAIRRMRNDEGIPDQHIFIGLSSRPVLDSLLEGKGGYGETLKTIKRSIAYGETIENIQAELQAAGVPVDEITNIIYNSDTMNAILDDPRVYDEIKERLIPTP